jgi:hypothetical protein
MQVASKGGRLARVLSPHLVAQSLLQSPDLLSHCHTNHQTLLSQPFSTSGISLKYEQYAKCSLKMQRASFCSGATEIEVGHTEAAREVYDKMLKSVNMGTAPPNALLWSLIEKSANHKDISLLFDMLKKLRVFRLSKLRIHVDFNCHLCSEITRACARVGAIDFGKKALWKHNLYALSPSVASANHLLSYAKEKNDVKLMIEIMKLLKSNDLPLQPSTADLVFSICYNNDKWGLLTKYSKRFVLAGVKLRQTSFDVWMDFAAKKGDIDTLWIIEKLRSNSMKKHSLATGFSLAKGFLLERKPVKAAEVIHELNQTLSDAKRPAIIGELQKLVSEWPMEVIKHIKAENKKDFGAGLQCDIPAMINSLMELGLEVNNINLEDLTTKDSLLC